MAEASSKKCGCKGIRSCLLCESRNYTDGTYKQLVKRYQYCHICEKAWPETETITKVHPNHKGEALDFPGVTLIMEFVTSEEEEMIVAEIDKTAWTASQSGRRKQDYGPKANFKKKKLKIGTFTGLPAFSAPLVARLDECACGRLSGFRPVELCNLEYLPARGSSIDPHFDDFWLWGERLVTLSLLSETTLSFSRPGGAADGDRTATGDGIAAADEAVTVTWDRTTTGDVAVAAAETRDVTNGAQSRTGDVIAAAAAETVDVISLARARTGDMTAAAAAGTRVVTSAAQARTGDVIAAAAVGAQDVNSGAQARTGEVTAAAAASTGDVTSGAKTSTGDTILAAAGNRYVARDADAAASIEVRVELPQRSLVVVWGPARTAWKHAIHREDVTARRLAITFRELTPEFAEHGPNEHIGKELLDIALTFNGIAIVS